MPYFWLGFFFLSCVNSTWHYIFCDISAVKMFKIRFLEIRHEEPLAILPGLCFEHSRRLLSHWLFLVFVEHHAATKMLFAFVLKISLWALQTLYSPLL